MDKPSEASQEDQEESMPEKQDEELHIDPGTEREFALLDDAIEFKMTSTLGNQQLGSNSWIAKYNLGIQTVGYFQ